jgi:hypothetical protein
LSIYASACDAGVYHYRDNTGFEIDAVVENRRGIGVLYCLFV